MRHFLFFLAILCAPFWVNAGGMETHGKPRSPLQVTIVPAQSDVVPAGIKPGDVVEFKVTGKSPGAEGDMKIKVELVGGVELLSGDIAWSGFTQKGEEKSFLIAVKVPRHGNGIIRARVSMSPSSAASFTAVAEYCFGKYAEKKPSHLPEIKKDNRGRSIREHRTN